MRLAPALCLRPFPPCHRQLALENVALRQQLTVYKRLAPRPKLRPADRRFWAGLARVWTGWRQALVIVSPDTVLRWQRRRFPRSNPWSGEWPRRIRSGAPHDPWRVAQARHPPGRRTVSRLLPKRRSPPLSDLADVSRQSRLGLGLHRLLYRAYRSLPRPLRRRRARSPPPARRPLRRHRAPHRRLDRSAARRCLP